MQCSPPGSSVNRVSQARIPECVVISISRGWFWPRDQACVFCIGRRILHDWVSGEVTKSCHQELKSSAKELDFLWAAQGHQSTSLSRAPSIPQSLWCGPGSPNLREQGVLRTAYKTTFINGVFCSCHLLVSALWALYLMALLWDRWLFWPDFSHGQGQGSGDGPSFRVAFLRWQWISSFRNWTRDLASVTTRV